MYTYEALGYDAGPLKKSGSFPPHSFLFVMPPINAGMIELCLWRGIIRITLEAISHSIIISFYLRNAGLRAVRVVRVGATSLRTS